MNLKLSFNSKSVIACLIAGAFSLSACSSGQEVSGDASDGGSSSGQEVSGNVLVDGSSTVFPISEAMAEEFMKANPGVRVTVGVSGSGGGFKKFCNDETDLSNASRPIKESEIELCEKGNVEYIEIPIAFDGLSVVVNPDNDFVNCLTIDELKKMWQPDAQGNISNWNQINPEFPDVELRLYGPGTDSGTYDYFTKAAVGKEGSSRGDYTASEDDNVIVQGVAADKGGLGFFGYAYYEENKDKLKLVEIDSGNGCVAPSFKTIADGSYSPLSRPEFFYVKKSVAERTDVKSFVEFQLAPENQSLISEVGYVPVPADVIELAKQRYYSGKVGSVFVGDTKGKSLKELMSE
ncbi:MAG: PstS family phosphate ABC transporter substrate-binding protein [Oscillatoria sp. SIO1A7]|nr:PstS family phosphate ABC transporter substrate-binding protein [Oscillatoria sp. SIO1A7]